MYSENASLLPGGSSSLQPGLQGHGSHRHRDWQDLLYIQVTRRESEPIFTLLGRHYLHLPSMTNEEIESLRVAACRNADQEDIEFVDPLYIDDDFIVVEQNTFTWFLVRNTKTTILG